MKLEELRIYNPATEIGERIWGFTKELSYYNKTTLGIQLIKAADSIAANISEGFGRYHYKDARNFYYYSRGSIFETKTWLKKCTAGIYFLKPNIPIL